jgi:hypothetical protein
LLPPRRCSLSPGSPSRCLAAAARGPAAPLCSCCVAMKLAGRAWRSGAPGLRRLASAWPAVALSLALRRQLTRRGAQVLSLVTAPFLLDHPKVLELFSKARGRRRSAGRECTICRLCSRLARAFATQEAVDRAKETLTKVRPARARPCSRAAADVLPTTDPRWRWRLLRLARRADHPQGGALVFHRQCCVLHVR